MQEILLSRCAMTALDAALRLKAGTLVHWQRVPAFWDETHVPEKLILGDVGPRPGWPNTHEWRFYSRTAEVWGTVGGESKRLARFEMVASRKQTEEGTPGDDDRWRLNEVRYHGVSRNRDGSWQEKEHYLSLNEPILG